MLSVSLSVSLIFVGKVTLFSSDLHYSDGKSNNDTLLTHLAYRNHAFTSMPFAFTAISYDVIELVNSNTNKIQSSLIATSIY